MSAARLNPLRACAALALALLGGLVTLGNAHAQEPLPATAASAPVAATPGDSERTVRGVTWKLQIDAPEALRALLARYLDLARFDQSGATTAAPAPAGNASGPTGPWAAALARLVPSAAGRAASDNEAQAPAEPGATAPRFEPIGRVELNRLVSATPAQAKGLLETQGYFEAQVRARIEEGDPLVVRVEVQPGPQTMVTALRFEFEGPLSVALDAGDAAAREQVEALRAAWELPVGRPFSQSQWSSAKSAALAMLRSQGYPLATWSGTSVQIDPTTRAASIYVVADSGPLLRLGALQIEGLERVKPRVLEWLMPYTPGAPYSERALLDFQDRLVKTGLFDTVAINVDLDPDLGTAQPEGNAVPWLPVRVRVRERTRRQTTFGVGYSDNTGPRVTLEQTDRQVFGWNWVGKGKLEVGRDKQSAETDFTSHPLRGRIRNLVSIKLAREEASDLVVTSQKLRLGRTQDGERIERLYYFEWQRAFARPSTGGGFTSDASAISGNYNWVWRDLDSAVLPTRGIAASAEVGLGRAFNLATGADWFTRAQARLTGYWPFARSWYGQARVQLGQAFARDGLLPYTLLFRAGGDESVRGYGYQDIGPEIDGTAVGGRVLGTGSLEIARPVSPRLPSVWLATFIDGGDAAPTWGEFKTKFGYGVGVRWRSPVGPLRIDMAWGEAVKRWHLHFSIGIAF